MISTNLSHLGNEQVEEEATTRPDVLHFFYQGNFIFIREKLGNLEKGFLWQSCVHVFLCSNKMIIFSQILYSMSNSSPHFTQASDWIFNGEFLKLCS